MSGGLPAAAFGGRTEVMERLAPLGPVYQAGTLSGNPVAVAAGLATLRHADDAVYAALDANELAAALVRETHPQRNSDVARSVTKVSGTPRSSAHPAHSAHSPNAHETAGFAVPRDGIEPPTRGFSVLTSTVRVRLPGKGLRLVRTASVTKVSGGGRGR